MSIESANVDGVTVPLLFAIHQDSTGDGKIKVQIIDTDTAI